MLITGLVWTAKKIGFLYPIHKDGWAIRLFMYEFLEKTKILVVS